MSFRRVGELIARHWPWVLLLWGLAAVSVRVAAPRWEQIADDGDLAYLPSSMPSVAGERLLKVAFPYNRAKSQVILVLAREDGPLNADDIYGPGYDLARRFKNLQGLLTFQRALEIRDEFGRRFPQHALPPLLTADGTAAETSEPDAGTADGVSRAAPDPVGSLRQDYLHALQDALDAFDEAIHLDERWAEHQYERAAARGAATAAAEDPVMARRLAIGYLNRSLFYADQGVPELAAADREQAVALDSRLAKQQQMLPEGVAQLPILDVWTWSDPVFGKRLTSEDKHAKLIVLQLSSEFLEVKNLPLSEFVHGQLDEVRANLAFTGHAGVEIGVSGSAAVGGDLLRSARSSIRSTHVFTIALVLIILAVVYRAPLLVAVPLATITVALIVSLNTVSLLCQLGQQPGFQWMHFRVFTTTQIFVVVILFGAGTDYCLFLISRYREYLEQGESRDAALASSLAGVGEAVAASALTTIVGLATMWFADFGKFHYSGPVIGLCLAITVLACVTFAPALLRALGPAVFWPWPPRPQPTEPAARLTIWQRLAHLVLRYPGRVLVGSVLLLAPLAVTGWSTADQVSYDLLSSLHANAPSRRGVRLLNRYFPVGEGGPLTLLAKAPESLDDPSGHRRIAELTARLYQIPGVTAVRCLVDPTGDFPPGTASSLVESKSWQNRVSRQHRRSKRLYLSQSDEHPADVARFDLVLDCSPFSPQALHVVERLREAVADLGQSDDPFWQATKFYYAGTSGGLRDLREVTRSDNRRIELLVVLTVFGVLLLILKRPAICSYMILSVLFSYFVTIGATELAFAWWEGPSFAGLDWKVPLFLFVILVAIGQDYNVYLATRVFEEQAQRGAREGLRVAMIRTGGIITSCGVIMAGTFVAMTAPLWSSLLGQRWPWLASWLGTAQPLGGMIQLGFALALGILLDTFIVRPVLVPAFLALWDTRPQRPAPTTTG